MIERSEKYDIIIVGAGIAGLSAALAIVDENKKRSDDKKIKFKIIEGDKEVGGRTKSTRTEHGNIVNWGATWLHGGEKNELYQFAKARGYKLEQGQRDNADKFITVVNGERQNWNAREYMLLGKTVEEVAKQLEKSQDEILGSNLLDIIKELNPRDRFNHKYVDYIKRMWLGSDADMKEPKVGQIITEPYSEGGIILKDGMQTIANQMAEEIGTENIAFGKTVREVGKKGDDRTIVCKDGSRYLAGKVIYTGSIGTIKAHGDDGNPLVKFVPSITDVRRHLKPSVMGDFTKLILQVSPKYIKTRGDLINTYVDFVDSQQPMQAHLFSGGSNTINIIFGGKDAVEKEKADVGQLKEQVLTQLTQLDELRDLKGYIVGEPIVTKWHENPLTVGANCYLHRHKTKVGAVADNNMWFCGEAFDDNISGNLASAHKSGIAAAQQVIQSLNKGRQK